MVARSIRVGSLWRSRWTVGAAVVALGLGGGGLLAASASNTPSVSSFVPITPCRLLDTRPANVVGPRATPIGPAATYTADVWGANGNCTIPTGATGLSMDVVAVNPTAPSFLTVFPADQPLPLASSLNWVAGQPPTPNAVTVSLSADGKVSFYNNGGTVDIAVDIVGYYVPTSAGPQGPQGPQGLKGDPGDPGPRPAQVLWVATSGGDFTSLAAALNAIGTTFPAGDASHRYVIKVAPGTYTEPGGVTVKDHVDIEGSGTDNTVITCTCGGPTSPFTDGSTATVRIIGPTMTAEVRDLTITNTGSGTYSTGVWNGGATAFGTVSLRDVVITTSGGTGNYALVNDASNISVDGAKVTATGASGSTEAFAVANLGGAGLALHAVDAYALGVSVSRIGVFNNGSNVELHDSIIAGNDVSIDDVGGGAVAYVSNTQLTQAVSGPGASFHCVTAFGGLYAPLNATCG